MSYFTCISCGVAFPSGEIQRAHYKSDWHRYNLKRKVSELPPVTAENFTQRVLAHRPPPDSALNENGADEQPSKEYCHTCSKHFKTPNAYDNHLKSRKHVEAEEKAAVEVKPENRLSHKNVGNVKDIKNLANKKVLGISGPSSILVENGSSGEELEEEEDWEDVDGDDEGWEDVDPLALEECLFCSAKSDSLEANIQHMTEIHSFFIPDLKYVIDLPGLIGYLGEKVGVGNVCLWCNEKGKSFHSVKSVQQHMVDKGHCKILHEKYDLEEYADYYNYALSYPGDTPGNADDEVDFNGLDDTNWEMTLPSGATIIHRSVVQVYRQNLPALREKSNRKIHRALGWTGTTGEMAIRQAKALNVMHFKRSRHYMQLGVKANKLQRYFRHQNPL